MSKFVVVINVTVEYEEDFEELDRMLQRASCIADYEYMHTFDLDEQDEETKNED